MAPMPPTVPLAGLQIDGGRPRAAQRRQYAPGEVPEPEPLTPPASHSSSQYRPADRGASNGDRPKANSAQRIDPSQIPRPDMAVRPERFSTRANLGQAPPAANSAFEVEDDGNCSPRFLRLTMNQLINTEEELVASAVPFAAIVQPLADVPPTEEPVPVVDFGELGRELGPVRCSRCRAYVNPYFQWLDRGRSYKCNFCGMVTQTPREYYSELDSNGYRRDAADRAELCCGAIEIIPPPEYQARPPLPPPVVVLIEATYGSVTAGILDTVVGSLAALLRTLPEHTRVALVTYNDSVHFYHAPADGSETRQFCVTDLEELCVPLPGESLLMPLDKALQQLEELTQLVPTIFAHTKRPDAAFGAAIEACAILLEETGGRLLAFQHTLPSLAPMKLVHRDDVRVYGTDKERPLLQPADESWSKLGKRLASLHICCSTFHFTAHNYVDLASMGTLSRLTGGQMYLYANCVPERREEWAAKLHAELHRNLTRNFGYEGVLRVRCSRGLRVESYLTGQHIFGDVDVDVPGIDADSAFAVTMALEEKLEPDSTPCVQCALLYTTANGERRIRVLTLSLLAVNSMSSLYRYADLDAVCNVLMRRAVHSCSRNTLHQAREQIVDTCVNILYNYRRTCAASTSSGQLILPESLKLLPLYALALTKNPLLRAGTEVRADERASLMALISRMAVSNSCAFIYPRLFGLHSLADASLDAHGLPETLPLSLEKLESSGAFLLDDAVNLYLWLGRGVDPSFLEAVLGVNTVEGLPEGAHLRLVARDHPLSAHVCRLVEIVRSQRPALQQAVRVLAPKDPLESRFLGMLLEDRAQTAMSYVEFLCHIHRQIQAKFQ